MRTARIKKIVLRGVTAGVGLVIAATALVGVGAAVSADSQVSDVAYGRLWGGG